MDKSKLLIRKMKTIDTQEAEKIFDKYWSDSFRSHLYKKLESNDMDWIVAEQDGEIVGVAASREAPKQMRMYSETDRVIEFYVVAVKYQGQGVGIALREDRVEKARKAGYEEIVFFSGVTHQDSWQFHDNSDFDRVGEHAAPNGEKGFIWLMKL